MGRSTRSNGWMKAITGSAEKQEVVVSVQSYEDVVSARQKGREFAATHGFNRRDCAVIVAAMHELAITAVAFATKGEISVRLVKTATKQGIEIVAEDRGPGIASTAGALEESYYSKPCGLRLGVRRLMDEFEMSSKLNGGNRVAVRKWQQRAEAIPAANHL